MRYVLGCLLVLVATPAQAMGRYVGLDLLAWSPDGASALIVRTESSSGQAGSKTDYVLVTADDPRPVVAVFSDHLDPERATEHVDRAACQRAADELQRALVARKFRGVTIRRERCKLAARNVLEVGPDAVEAAGSWVAHPRLRAPSALETASWEAAKTIVGDAGDEADVAATTGKLILVFSGVNGDNSGPAHAAAFSPTKTGYQPFVADLR
jgi:hypothetical protein